MIFSFEHCGSCCSSRQSWPPRLVAMHNCMHLSSQQTRYLEHSHKPKTQWAEERLGGLLFCRRSSTKYLYLVPVQGGKGRPTWWHGLGWPALSGPTRNKLLFGPAQYYFTKDQATWLLFCELATMPLIISCIISIQLFHNFQGYYLIL